jgi:hypothetical protein
MSFVWISPVWRPKGVRMDGGGLLPKNNITVPPSPATTSPRSRLRSSVPSPFQALGIIILGVLCVIKSQKIKTSQTPPNQTARSQTARGLAGRGA